MPSNNNKSTENDIKKKTNNKNNLNKNNISLIKNTTLFLKNNKNFPIFSYEGGDGFQCVKFKLRPKESIRADAGAMNYMSSNITTSTESGSVFSGIGRMFSGSSFFYNIFTNNSPDSSTSNFSGVNPGNIGAFYIPKGQSLNMVSDSYICSTPNLEITTNIRSGGFILGYGLTFVNIEAKDTDGIVWGAAFGNVIEKTIKPGHSLKIDNGIIMAFEAHTEIHTNTIGGFTSTFFSGEGLVSKIENNGKKSIKMFLQSRSKTGYLKYLKEIIKK